MKIIQFKIIYQVKNHGAQESEYCDYSAFIEKDWPPTKLDVEIELRKKHPKKDIRVLFLFPLEK